MSEGDGGELDPVVAVLEGEDEAFLEMLARDIEAARAFASDLREALTGSADVTGTVTGAEAIPAEMAGVGEQAAAEFSSAFDERVHEEAAVSAEDWASYAEMFAPVGTEGGDAFSAGFTEAAAPTPEKVSELLRQGLDEQAQAVMAQLPTVVEPAAVAAGEEIGASVGEGVKAGLEGEVEVVQESAAEFVDNLVGIVRAGGLTAAQAIDVLAGEEVRTTASMSQSIATLRGTWASAVAALEEYGAAEAQAAVSAAVLAEAQDELLGSNTMLMYMYQQMADGLEVSAEDQVSSLKDVADAQKQVTAATQAMVEAQTEVNLAVIQNDTGLLDEANSLRAVAAAAQMTGVEMTDLLAELEDGTYATLNQAAADAKASLSSIQLSEAQQRLAAANLTLVETYSKLAAGEEVSAEAQSAALGGVKSAQSEVDGLAGELEGAGAAAEGAAGGMGMFSQIMYGPLGYALFFIQPLLSSVSGLFKTSAASAATFTASVTQDSNAVGDNTAAVIQSTLAASNLNVMAQQLGVTQAQLIEYAAGETQAQQAVAAAYQKTQTALSDTSDNERVHSKAQMEGATSAQLQSQNLTGEKIALDQVTASVQQAIIQDQQQSDALLAAEQTTQIYTAAVNALGTQQLLQIQQTQMSNEATAKYGDQILAAETKQQYMNAAVGAAGVNLLVQANATEITNRATAQFGSQVLWAESSVSAMNAAMGAAVASNRESALTSADASVGLLNLGSSQTVLNAQLSSGEALYTEASAGAGAYNAVLTSLSGTENSLLGTEAAYTTALAGLTTAVQTNGDSLDVNTAKGAANITVLTQAATAADAAAVAVYNNDVANGNAAGAYKDATDKLAQEKEAFIEAGDKADLNKQKVQQLADELFKLPPNITTNVNVNTKPALDGLATLLERINKSSGTVSVYETTSGTVGTTQTRVTARASGGPVEAGQLYKVGEQGEEWFVPSQAGVIIPNEQLSAYGGGYGGGAPVVNVTVLLDSREITSSSRVDALQYKTRNGTTGFS